MPRLAFFLRAVNVSGTNRVTMERLRADLGAAGLRDVRTLLASGNLVADGDNPVAMRAAVEAAVAAQAGRRCAALPWDAAGLDRVLAAVAPVEAALTDGAKVAVTLLAGRPDAAAWARLAAFDGKGDRVIPAEDAVILVCRSQADTPYTTDRLERLLGVEGTGRNPATLRKVRAALG